MWTVRIGATVAVTWFVLDRVGLDLETVRTLDPAAWRPHPVGFALASLVLFSMYVASAAIWGRMVSDLGGPSLPPSLAVRLFMIANLGRYVPGKVWQIAGLAALAKARGVPATTATGAAILGQGIALAAATVIGLGAFVSAPEPTRTAGLAAGALLLLAMGLAAVPAVFERAAAVWFRVTRSEAPEGLGSAHSLRWVILLLLNWAGYALSFWLLLTSFGADAPIVPTASAFAAAYVIGYLWLPAPAGIGVREGFLVAFLTPTLGAAEAGAIAVISRVWMTAVEVVPAGIFWVMHLRAGKEAADV